MRAESAARIGKSLPERPEGAPFDPRLEWERDGQYIHYLTRWMHSLNRAYRTTGESKYTRRAKELARAAFCSAMNWLTGDHLGLGGLLADVRRAGVKRALRRISGCFEPSQPVLPGLSSSTGDGGYLLTGERTGR